MRLHRSKRVRDGEIKARAFSDLLQGNTRGDLREHRERIRGPLLVEIKYAELGDDAVDYPFPGQRQGAVFQKLMLVPLGKVLHRHYNLWQV